MVQWEVVRVSERPAATLSRQEGREELVCVLESRSVLFFFAASQAEIHDHVRHRSAAEQSGHSSRLEASGVGEGYMVVGDR